MSSTLKKIFAVAILVLMITKRPISLFDDATLSIHLDTVQLLPLLSWTRNEMSLLKQLLYFISAFSGLRLYSSTCSTNHVAIRRLCFTEDLTSQKLASFIVTALKISNLT
jgi:hypothetical protein